MKIRAGHVSNSSSSSFTCDVCGHTESGWDACLSDVGMYECMNGHTFCVDEAVGSVAINPDEDGEVDHYGVPAEACPICTLKHIDSSTIMEYV